MNYSMLRYMANMSIPPISIERVLRGQERNDRYAHLSKEDAQIFKRLGSDNDDKWSNRAWHWKPKPCDEVAAALVATGALSQAES